ncbi:MAG: glycosyltransferase [Rhodothermales bacterium]|nr:glycosyltransferase [Rhodothermales bacterium]
MLLNIILALAIAAYLATAWIVSLALAKDREVRSHGLGSDPPSVAVIVAARDEEQHIERCVEALIGQRYAAEHMEIVVVDDHSEDATAEILRRLSDGDSRVTLLESSELGGIPGKASALALGVESTSADIILTTDADCEPPPGWVSSMVERLQAGRLACLGGVTLATAPGAFSRAQALDWLLGLGVAGGLSELGYPLTAMGNNMAFRRLDYEAVGGYRHFASSPTEDFALFRALALRAGGSQLVVDPKLTTHTRPVSTLSGVLSQRRRWARGGLAAPLPVHILYATIWLAHAAPLLIVPISVWTALIFLLLKVAADALVLYETNRRLGRSTDWPAFPLLQSLLWLYVLVLPFTLAVSPGLSWKGRKL